MPEPTPHAAPDPARLPRSQRVLLLIDFITPLKFPGAEHMAEAAVTAARATAGLKRRLAAQGVPTLYANDNFGLWQSDFHSQVATCLGLPGAPGEIARLLYPQAEDITLLKPRHSAFFASPLELLLREIGARTLVICGLSTDMCVQLTAAEAFIRGLDCWVPGDCSAALTPQAHEGALAYMRDVLRCEVKAATAP